MNWLRGSRRYGSALLVLSLCGCGAGRPTETPTILPPAASPTRAAPPNPGTFERGRCPFVLPEDTVEGSDLHCGTLWVPEHWNADAGAGPQRVLRLAVAIFHAADTDRGTASVPSGVVIYLAGGPGGSALENLRYGIPDAYEAVTDSGRDLVVFDQRGVGRSRPALDCPEVEDLAADLADREVDGRKVDRTEARDMVIDGFAACGETLREVADLSAYNSAASADDVKALWEALGYEQVTLWGGSYGTRLALEVMRRHPEGIRSVVLDAVYPPDADLYVEAPGNFDRALEKLFAGCAASPVCSERYPQLSETFYATVARLDEAPQPAPLTDPFTGSEIPAIVDGDVLVGLVFQLLYSTEAKLLIPELIRDAAGDDFAALSNIRSSLLIQQSIGSRGMMFSVQCNEEIAFSSVGALDASRARYPELAGTFAHGLLGQLTYDVCERWDAGHAESTANEPVHSDLPTLIMTGEFDPVTPPAWGTHVAETLTHAYAFEYPGVGHGASFLEGCPRDMFLAFLEDPLTRPDSTCIAQMRP